MQTLFLELMSDVCNESYNFKEGHFLLLEQGEVESKRGRFQQYPGILIEKIFLKDSNLLLP